MASRQHYANASSFEMHLALLYFILYINSYLSCYLHFNKGITIKNIPLDFWRQDCINSFDVSILIFNKYFDRDFPFHTDNEELRLSLCVLIFSSRYLRRVLHFKETQNKINYHEKWIHDTNVKNLTSITYICLYIYMYMFVHLMITPHIFVCS